MADERALEEDVTQQSEDSGESSVTYTASGDVVKADRPNQVRSEQIQLIAPNRSPTGVTARHIVPTQIVNGVRLVPAQFQFCEMPDVIALVASMLQRLLEHNDVLAPSQPLTRFHSKAAPNITPLAYLTRITTFTNVDPCILIILLYYIDRLNAHLTINSLTVHRFLIAAVCCGSKALSDSFATNSRYAKVGGVELVEMNALERELLFLLSWRLATSGALLEQYWRSLVAAHPGYGLLPSSQVSSLPSNSSTHPAAQPQPSPSASAGASAAPSTLDRPTKRIKGVER